MKKYSRVSYVERCQIVALLETKISIIEIAKILNRSKSTIYRELKRNSSRNEYRAIGAQNRARTRFKRCRRKKVLNDDLIKEVPAHFQHFRKHEVHK